MQGGDEQHFLGKFGAAPRVEIVKAAAQPEQGIFRMEQGLGRLFAHGADNPGTDYLYLTEQEGQAGPDFLILWRPAAGRETFNQAGEVHILSGQADGCQHFCEQVTAGTQEG